MANCCDSDEMTCAVCLEVYEKPVTTTCGHSFCSACHDDLSNKIAKPKCPLCSTEFKPKQTRIAKHIEASLSKMKGSCKGCNEVMPLCQLRSHGTSCSHLKSSGEVKFQPVAETKQPVPSSLPNRSTFKCPYCGLQNLDNNALITHVNSEHRNSNKQVVCPVCASMPWGDPNLKSSNFLNHLNSRHKFEYHTYVDYQQDEDEVLQAILLKSQQDQ